MFENYRTFETTYAGRPLIVETGKTLLENDLEPVETIVPISARLIANPAAYAFRSGTIDRLTADLARKVKQL